MRDPDDHGVVVDRGLESVDGDGQRAGVGVHPEPAVGVFPQVCDGVVVQAAVGGESGKLAVFVTKQSAAVGRDPLHSGRVRQWAAHSIGWPSSQVTAATLVGLFQRNRPSCDLEEHALLDELGRIARCWWRARGSKRLG